MTAVIVVDLPEDPTKRPLLVEGGHDFGSVTDTIAKVAEDLFSEHIPGSSSIH